MVRRLVSGTCGSWRCSVVCFGSMPSTKLIRSCVCLRSVGRSRSRDACIRPKLGLRVAKT